MQLAFCLFKFFPYGGLQRDFLKIAKECFERGHQIHVFTMSWEGPAPDGFKIYELPPRGITNHQRCVSFAKQVQEKISQQNFDCVIGFNKMPNLDIYFAGDGCFQYKARYAHKRWFRLTPRYRTFMKLEKSVFESKSNSQILLLNEQEKEKFMQFYGTFPQRFHLIPPGISADRVATGDSEFISAELRAEFGVDKQDLMVVSIASDFKTKGLDRSIKAIASLPPSIRKKIHFFIIGEDEVSPYENLAKKLNVDKNLIFLGSREDVGRFLMAADLMLHPAVVENAGMVILEALACGSPVLTTGNCGYAFHVQRAQAGVVLEGSFSQIALNHHLLEMLTQIPKSKENWTRNALAYTTRIDIFSLAQEAANIIERFPKTSKDELSLSQHYA